MPVWPGPWIRSPAATAPVCSRRATPSTQAAHPVAWRCMRYAVDPGHVGRSRTSARAMDGGRRHDGDRQGAGLVIVEQVAGGVDSASLVGRRDNRAGRAGPALPSVPRRRTLADLGPAGARGIRGPTLGHQLPPRALDHGGGRRSRCARRHSHPGSRTADRRAARHRWHRQQRCLEPGEGRRPARHRCRARGHRRGAAGSGDHRGVGVGWYPDKVAAIRGWSASTIAANRIPPTGRRTTRSFDAYVGLWPAIAPTVHRLASLERASSRGC